jgi:hypothetical protein
VEDIEEKHQKEKPKPKKAKENTDRRLMVVSTENVPVSQSAPYKDAPTSPP